MNSVDAPYASPAYRPDIEGLRALAVIAVLLFHLGVAPASGGFVGVDVLFVISGFLIGGIAVHEAAAGTFRLGDYFACIAIPSPAGLAAGAGLFQLASIIDGVDGEIARATRRSSKAGASLDSLIDAFTNCAFLAGAGASFAAQGEAAQAAVCAAALAMQVAGLTILGASAWRREGVVHFDSAKAAVASEGGAAGRLLKDLTSRDFYCFAFMVASFAGVLGPAIMVFGAGSVVWLTFVIRTAVRG